MALGTLAILESAAAVGPVSFYRCSLIGDAAYGAGGTAGLLAALRTLMKQPNLNILDVKDVSPVAASLSRLEYDHGTEKLFARVKTTGVESAVADQSAITYNLFIIAA
jgi:hypothetical protein